MSTVYVVLDVPFEQSRPVERGRRGDIRNPLFQPRNRRDLGNLLAGGISPRDPNPRAPLLPPCLPCIGRNRVS